jgi:poly-gamma-glutamate synthesis protein (capsule biosynthesis protein)
MLARNVGQKMISANNWNLPFLKVATLLKSGDLTISNLESPFEQGGQTIFSGMTFGADPKSISGLKYAGINLVTLANNHFGNQGKSGMTYTMDLLKQNNISYVGAGNNFNEAHSPKIVDVKGLKIATLDYDGVDSTPSSYFADSSSPGSAKMDINQVKIDIKNTKELNPDMIIVNMHAGTEYKYLPNSTQTDFAHAAINDGADMVIGNHPHSVETFENYNGKMIFYSLGNLVFDQMWSEQTKEGMILKLNLYGNSIKSFSLIPVYIIDYNQPQIATDSQAKQILSNILPDSKL